MSDPGDDRNPDRKETNPQDGSREASLYRAEDAVQGTSLEVSSSGGSSKEQKQQQEQREDHLAAAKGLMQRPQQSHVNSAQEEQGEPSNRRSTARKDRAVMKFDTASEASDSEVSSNASEETRERRREERKKEVATRTSLDQELHSAEVALDEVYNRFRKIVVRKETPREYRDHLDEVAQVVHVGLKAYLLRREEPVKFPVDPAEWVKPQFLAAVLQPLLDKLNELRMAISALMTFAASQMNSREPSPGRPLPPQRIRRFTHSSDSSPRMSPEPARRARMTREETREMQEFLTQRVEEMFAQRRAEMEENYINTWKDPKAKYFNPERYDQALWERSPITSMPSTARTASVEGLSKGRDDEVQAYGKDVQEEARSEEGASSSEPGEPGSQEQPLALEMAGFSERNDGAGRASRDSVRDAETVDRRQMGPGQEASLVESPESSERKSSPGMGKNLGGTSLADELFAAEFAPDGQGDSSRSSDQQGASTQSPQGAGRGHAGVSLADELLAAGIRSGIDYVPVSETTTSAATDKESPAAAAADPPTDRSRLSTVTTYVLRPALILLTLQVYVACERERRLWLEGNQLTRHHLVDIRGRDPYWMFLPGVDLRFAMSRLEAKSMAVLLLQTADLWIAYVWRAVSKAWT